MHRRGELELKVPVEEFATQRDPGGEHGDGHEADSLAVHEESVSIGGRQTVGGAHPLHPLTHIHTTP